MSLFPRPSRDSAVPMRLPVRSNPRTEAPGAGPAPEVGLEAEGEGPKGAAQKPHRAVGVAAGPPPLDLAPPALQPGEAPLRRAAVAERRHLGGEGLQPEDARPALP